MQSETTIKDAITLPKSKKKDSLLKSEKIKNLEIMAEQVITYLAPQTSKRNTLQILLFFEFGKAYYNLRALYQSANSPILLENSPEAASELIREREEVIEEKKKEILDLSERENNRLRDLQSAASMSKRDVIRRIEKILGVKKVKAKRREGGRNMETRELEMVEEERGEGDIPGDEEQEFNYVRSMDAKRFDKLKFNLNYSQLHPRTKSSIPMIKTIPIDPSLLKSHKTPLRIKISEILAILRPVLHCIVLIMNKKPKFRTLLASLIIDIVVFLLRICYKGGTLEERKELRKRNFRLLYIYFFRQPLWNLFTRPVIVEPLLNKFVRIEFLKNFILQAMEFRSSFSMNM